MQAISSLPIQRIKRQFTQRLVSDRLASHLYIAYRKIVHSSGQPRRKSPFVNIYHCCTQKSASTWFKSVFSDPIVYKNTGLLPLPFAQMGLNFARIEHPLPRRTIGVHLYVSHSVYKKIPKLGAHRGFFVMRDPRDVVVSSYFYARHSSQVAANHERGVTDPFVAARADLETQGEGEGLRYMVDRLEEWGAFDVQRSWAREARRADSEEIRILRYEDLARDERSFLRHMLDMLEIDLPSEEFEELYRRTCYRKKAEGRVPGIERIEAHFRKGVAGDWHNYFDRELDAHFRRRTGDLVEELGYET